MIMNLYDYVAFNKKYQGFMFLIIKLSFSLYLMSCELLHNGKLLFPH